MSRLRAASESDCEAVYAINFAPDVRAVSGTKDKVSYASHAAWFVQRLATPAPFWMIEDAGAIVGDIRIDPNGRISIALDERARGRGIGRRAIASACQQWNREVTAEIDPTNTASIACFEACGFELDLARTKSDGLLVYTWRPL